MSLDKDGWRCDREFSAHVFFRRASRAGGVYPSARAQAPADSGAVIRTETKLVLVDSVVTDKKGNYVHDLEAKDFRFLKTTKNSRSRVSRSKPANRRPPTRRSTTWCCSSTTPPWILAIRRAHGRPRRSSSIPTAALTGLMAIVNFGGALQIAQNFTEDTQRLKNVVNGIKFSAVAPNASDANAPQISAQMASFGSRDVLYALKDLAKSLSSIPGRKTVILITGGFPLTPEIMSEATAVISACNKSNVAIYPIDVRGLVAGTPQARLSAPDRRCSLCTGVLYSRRHGVLYAAARRWGRRWWRSRRRTAGHPGGGTGLRPVVRRAAGTLQRQVPPEERPRGGTGGSGGNNWKSEPLWR